MKIDTILVGDPDNIEEIHAKFPAVKDNPYVVFTYYPHVYKRIDLDLPLDLQIHEATHLKQQEVMGGAAWWKSYLEDEEFLLEQEIEAYGTQLAFLMHYSKRKQMERGKEQFALQLSSAMYGNIISYAEAESKIRNYAKSVDKSSFEVALKRITREGSPAGGAVHNGDEQDVSEPSDGAVLKSA
jgi:hypothetical protein